MTLKFTCSGDVTMKKRKLVAYTLGEKIAQLRNAMNLTQKEMASLLHLDRSTYAYYEIDKTTPSLTNLLLMARLFNVTVDLLIDDKTAIRAPYTPCCMFCGEARDVKQFAGRSICVVCAVEIKSLFE